MISSWGEVVRRGVRNFTETIQQDESETAPNPARSDTAVRARSDASARNSQRPQMPIPSTKFFTKTIPAFLGAQDHNDDARTDPVILDSDDEDKAGEHNQTTHADRQRVHRSPHTRSASQIAGKTHSGSPTEARLVGRLTRRNPSGTQSAEAKIMKSRPFKASGGLKPVDTFAGRSAFVQAKSADKRLPPYQPPVQKSSHKNDYRENNHARPEKRLKIDDSHQKGDSAALAISLDDSQPRDDSADELALSPKPESRAKTGARQQARSASPSMSSTAKGYIGNGQPGALSSREFSPADESTFTRSAAQQRKAEKDGILDSPPEPVTNPAAAQNSRFFNLTSTNKSATRARQSDMARTPSHHGPDIIQGDKNYSAQPSSADTQAYAEMPIKSLSRLIEGKVSQPVIKNTKARKGRTSEQILEYKLSELFYRNLIEAAIYVVKVDTSKKELSLHTDSNSLGNEPLMTARLIRQIAKMQYASDTPELVSLEFSGVAGNQDKMILRFASQERATNFVQLLQMSDPAIKAIGRYAAFMEDYLTNLKTACLEYRKRTVTQPPKHQAAAQRSTRASDLPNISKQGQRMIDNLDPPLTAKSPTIISGAERSAGFNGVSTQAQLTRKRPRESVVSEDTPSVLAPLRRVTRSQDEQGLSVRPRRRTLTPPRPKASESGILGPPWVHDLVYPQPGRRAAIVPFDDLARLDDAEYLNDNLILFFMRYLETYMEKNNPELHKRTYFFNTYFYETLTKTPQGKKALNYDAVTRWTKNINLFSRDFVVVPVNENLHWYVAIICNLPWFLGDKGETGWNESNTGSRQPDLDHEDESDLQTVETQDSLADLTISDSEKREQMPSKKKKPPGRRKSARRSLPKYAVDKPIIITLDSLGQARSTTCTNLRNYIVHEAKDKRNLIVDPNDLKGMTAKEIPIQTNYSDCGLYLCIYLEQFVANPYDFVRRILQRDVSPEQWPRTIRSTDLRSRLRELIREMHRIQEKEPPKMDEPVIGHIMIDKSARSPTPAAVEPDVSTMEAVEMARNMFEGDPVEQTRHSVGTPIRKRKQQDDSSSETGPELHDDSDEIEDNDKDDLISNEPQFRNRAPEAPKARPGFSTASNQKPHSDPIVEVEAFPPGKTLAAHTTPGQLTARMDRYRSQTSLQKRQQTPDHSSAKRHKIRSSSQLTDELTGEKSYLLQGIESFAVQDLADAEPINADTSNGGFKIHVDEDAVEGRKSASPSPEPEVTGERQVITTKQTPKRQRQDSKPVKKMRAPETEADLARMNSALSNGAGLKSEAEVAETQDGDHQHSSGQKRDQKDVTDDSEMLIP